MHMYININHFLFTVVLLYAVFMQIGRNYTKPEIESSILPYIIGLQRYTQVTIRYVSRYRPYDTMHITCLKLFCSKYCHYMHTYTHTQYMYVLYVCIYMSILNLMRVVQKDGSQVFDWACLSTIFTLILMVI